MNVRLSKADVSTVAKIVAEKAVQMYDRGSFWHRSKDTLSAVDMIGLANKILKGTGESYDWGKFIKSKNAPKKKK